MTTRKPLILDAAAGKIKGLPSSDTLLTNASASGGASLNIPHGTAPSSPANGDVWSTSAGIFVRVNGATIGPLSAAGGGGGGGGSFIRARCYLNTGSQNSANNGFGKVPIDTVDFDPNSIFNTSSKRFIPNLAGVYLFAGRARTNTSGLIAATMAINGGAHTNMGTDSSGNASSGTVFTPYLNGSTDYVELFAFTSAVRTFTTGNFDTFMQILGPF